MLFCLPPDGLPQQHQTMAATQRESLFFSENFHAKVVKLKVKDGSHITLGQILFQFEPEENSIRENENANSHISNGSSKFVVRASSAGLLEKLYIKEGDVIDKGYLIFVRFIRVWFFSFIFFSFF